MWTTLPINGVEMTHLLAPALPSNLHIGETTVMKQEFLIEQGLRKLLASVVQCLVFVREYDLAATPPSFDYLK